MTRNSELAASRVLSQIEAVSLASALFLALVTPGLILEWLIGKPLGKLRQFCSHVKQGDYKQHFFLPNEARDGDGEDEIVVLMRDMNWMARQIEIRENDLQQAVNDLWASRRHIEEQNKFLVTINSELLATQEQLKKRTADLETACCHMHIMAMTDPLTAIANRRCFFTTLEQQYVAQVCHCQSISLLILDIDRFKSINDTYGHGAGDNVLLEIAGIIQKNCRASDLAARIGGEEYALLLPGITSGEAVAVAARIQHAVAEHDFKLDEKQFVPITVSIGICTLSEHPCIDKEKLYSYADQALYHSKHSGRNAISVFDPETRTMSRVNC